MEQHLAARELGLVEPWRIRHIEYCRRLLNHHKCPLIEPLVPERNGNYHLGGHQLSSSVDIALSPSDGRYLLTVGSDSLINLFDMNRALKHGPISSLAKPESHQFAISSASWYPFDNGMFITGSMDHLLRVWDTERLECAFEFDLKDRIYTHAISNVAQTHNLIACGTTSPTIRFCDLRTKSMAHALIGHKDLILSLQWSPVNEFMIVSGSADNTIRVWDIRKSGKHSLQTLRMLSSSTTASSSSAIHPDATSHNGAIIGLEWTSDGHFLLSSGNDRQLRLWDMATFKQKIQPEIDRNNLNSSQNTVRMAITPVSHIWPPIYFYPRSDGTINMGELISGALISRLNMHFSPVRAVVWDPFRDRLLSAGSDSIILSWKISDGEVEDDHEQHNYDCGPECLFEQCFR